MRYGGLVARVAIVVALLTAIVELGTASPAAAASPAVSFAPSSVQFGDQVVGTTSAPDQKLTVTNSGSADLHISGLTSTAATARPSLRGTRATSSSPSHLTILAR
jgi:hypothetical protein